MVDIEKLKKFFAKDRFCLENGITIAEVNEDCSVITVEVEDRHLNASNSAQGGLIFTLADFAFAVHANATGRRTVTQNASITYVRPATGKKLFAVAKPVHVGRTTCLYNVEVKDERDKTVAVVTVNGFVLDDNPELQ